MLGRIGLCILVALGSFSARAADGDFYYVLDSNPDKYASPDEACQVAYAADGPVILANNPSTPTLTVKVLPYQSPVQDPNSTPPNNVFYDCQTYYQFTNTKTGDVSQASYYHAVWQKRDGCPQGQIYNPIQQSCESPDQDQERKEEGDPITPPLGGVITCAGNPVSIASGNKFQKEEDFVDGNGELRFVRYYNGLSGGWSTSYGAALYLDPKAILLFSEDGRRSIFTMQNGVAIPEATEQGTLQLVNGQWTYFSPSNEQMTFDTQGRLVRYQLADGRAQTLTYTSGGGTKLVASVTDSVGHQLQFTMSYLGGPVESLSVGSLAVNYTYDNFQRLTSLVRTWQGHTAKRSYFYEVTAKPFLLTGIADERGIRYATWQYDAQGRAISSEHANGAEKVTLAYPDESTTVVTNSIGHNVTYRYQIIQGVKRVTAIEGEPTAGCPASNTTYTYTDRGQVATRTDALGTVTTYAYDTLGRETSRVEAKGSSQERTTTTTWDATRFLPLTVTTPDRVTTYTYDDQGRLRSSSVHAIKE
ncbi:putative deoxyribonuclease RhsC [Dyella sp. AD56]|nr:putative deoxyribonuclease RhsC [Dyella sp. AD56]